MEASAENLLIAIRNAPQFVIPIYQRSYRWAEADCDQVFQDALRTGEPGWEGHFIGPVVYVQAGLYQASKAKPLLVIDGQQRLTTVTLLLTALARRFAATDAELAEDITNFYLLNPLARGEARHKLLLGPADRQPLLDVIAGANPDPDGASRVGANFAFFDRKVSGLDDAEAARLYEGIHKLLIVDVSLDRDKDNPQLVFESMNSTGKALSQADLIRNFVLMGLEPDDQTALYKSVWKPMEDRFGTDPNGVEFNKFIRHYLTVKTGSIPKIGDVYDAFKAYAGTPTVAASGVEALVDDVAAHAGYYCAMALGAEKDKDLAPAFRDLRELTVDVAYPLLLEFYADYAGGLLPVADFVAAVRTVEAYVFRRVVCEIPTNSLNKTFSTIGKDIDKDHYLVSFQAALLGLPTYRRFPSDAEFRRELASRDLYNFSRRGYFLRRLENDGRKERVAPDEYTIEHILPQNPDLPQAWREDLGPDWSRVQETYLHTLGNLTLTGYNSEYQDRPFKVKRDLPGEGMRFSPLRLNQGLGEVETWDEAAIVARASRLADLAEGVWSRPRLPDSVLVAYKTRGADAPAQAHTLAEFALLAPGTTTRALFDEFSKQVRALDPVVAETVAKTCITYKAESTFVAAYPRSYGLWLELAIPCPLLHDPLDAARARAGQAGDSAWGTGAKLRGVSELPYVLGLVRQAFDRQMAADDY